MYGINLKYRFPMLCAMIGSGLAGLLACGLNGVMANGIGVGGLPGILSIQPSYWQVFALAMAIAIIILIVLTSFIYQREIPPRHAGHCLIFFGRNCAPRICRNNVMTHLPHWWQNGVIYQIYPKSFQDTTGSGTGDLRGYPTPDYLHKLGVDAIWLTPLCLSRVDNGYDVANYTAIDPTYGTLDDFDELVTQAKSRGFVSHSRYGV